MMEQRKLTVVPINYREAMAFILRHHRHHKPPRGYKYAVAVSDGEKIVGVATTGRPVARNLQDGWTLEVTRVATDGTPNACSKLYAAAWKVARDLGYKLLVTYILATEKGTSVRAAGWKEVGRAGGGSWNRKARPRVDVNPTQGKIRFEKGTEW